MKKLLAITIVILLLLSACTSVSVSAASTPNAQASVKLVRIWMKAYETYDIKGMTALLSEDYIFMDYGSGDGPMNKNGFSQMMTFSGSSIYRIHFQSLTVTPNGIFAAVEALYSQIDSKGKWASTPATGILQISNGLISRETWYYDSSVFY